VESGWFFSFHPWEVVVEFVSRAMKTLACCRSMGYWRTILLLLCLQIILFS